MNVVTLYLYMKFNGITWRWKSAFVDKIIDKIDKIMYS